MDINAYIDSGILEQYVIGSLSSTQSAQVEQMMAQYPEVAAEVKSIEQTLQAYAQSQGVKPKLTEDQLIDHLKKNLPSVSPPSSKFPWTWLLSSALLFFIAFSVYRFSKLNNALNQSKIELQLQKSKCDEIDNQNKELQSIINRITNPQNKLIKLAGTKLSPTSYASVLIDSTSRKLYFDFAGLPTPPKGKQYQLWAIQDGKPLDMGVIQNNVVGSIHQTEKSIVDRASAFAVTLEDEGGKSSPTLDQMYVVGGL